MSKTNRSFHLCKHNVKDFISVFQTDEDQNKLKPTGARPNVPDTNANDTIDIAQIISEVNYICIILCCC